jgi:hypothetical protein
MNEIPHFVEKYLSKFLISKWSLEYSDCTNINLAVVIPAISEYENIKNLLTSLSENDPEYFSKSIVVFVINNSEDSSEAIKSDNLKSLELLRGIIKKKSFDKFTEKILRSNLRIGLVDASSELKTLPVADAGVGLARKIGMDLAIKCFDYSSNDKKILLCLDADCTVSPNYISEVYRQFNNKNFSAATLNFEHSISGFDDGVEAIICYEIFLRYYVLGLKYANSPFAFHTIGSSMACDLESYIKIGGMNKKKAAEDFYFLEKLAKVVPISMIDNVKVYPSARGSWRVPFGTGQRVNRFLQKIQNEHLLYSHESFEILKKWLEVFLDESALSEIEYLDQAKKINLSLYKFLIQQHFDKDWQRIIQNSSTLEQITKQKNLWFDGFRTLKLIHYLRDNEFELEPMFSAVDNLLSLLNIRSDLDRILDIPSIDVQKDYLNVLRSVK